MKERPILFTPENIRRVQRREKWQTRRVIDPQPTAQLYSVNNGHEWAYPDPRDPDVPDWDRVRRCPHGQPGDRLWVRESLAERNGQWFYRADDTPVLVSPADEAASVTWAHHKSTSYASAIHMPRFAARLFLDITDIRVQRIQEISELDCEAELGAAPHSLGNTAYAQFRTLWDDINGDRGFGWERNPWVWAISFALAARRAAGG